MSVIVTPVQCLAGGNPVSNLTGVVCYYTLPDVGTQWHHTSGGIVAPSADYCSSDIYRLALYLLFWCLTSSGRTLPTCGGEAPWLPRCPLPTFQ